MSRKQTHSDDAAAEGLDQAAEILDETEELERRAAELERRAREIERRLEDGAEHPRDHSADITIVLDRSGSMDSMRDEAIESFNAFLADQQSVAGEASVTLVQFDHMYEPVFEGCELAAVSNLTSATFRPRGRTALLDAIGRTILRTERRLDGVRDQPDLIVFVILTDGHENASVEFTRRKVFDMIRGRESRCGWRFVFLGANQDAISEGGQIGVAFDRAMSVGDSRDEFLAANRLMSAKLCRCRISGQKSDLDFTPAERHRAKRDADH